MTLFNSVFTWFMKKRIHQIELFMKYPNEVQREWFEQLLATAEETEAFGTLATAGMLGQLTDAQIFDMASTLRADGYDVWIMPQSPDLPFGNTREDMVIVKP